MVIIFKIMFIIKSHDKIKKNFYIVLADADFFMYFLV